MTCTDNRGVVHFPYQVPEEAVILEPMQCKPSMKQTLTITLLSDYLLGGCEQENCEDIRDTKQEILKLQNEDFEVSNVALKQTNLVELMKKLNNFYFNGINNKDFLPFMCSGCKVGLISPVVLNHLRNYPDVFTITEEQVSFNPRLATVSERNSALDAVLSNLRDSDAFKALQGWRSECYEIRNRFSDPVLFSIERAASPLFGVRKYGVQINGYVHHSSLGLCIWFQQRSLSKPTWPGLTDNFVGGGVSEGISVRETAVKEAFEEANVSSELADRLRPAGSVSFLHQTERGIHPNTEFVFDLELPEDFVPQNNDGEVSGWKLVPVLEVVEIICSKYFKITSSPVVVDWLIRMGFLTEDIEPDLKKLVELLHIPLHSFYR